MAKALLYQPRRRWRVGAAFGAAVLIHFAAVGLASLHQHKQIDESASAQPGSTEIEIQPNGPIDDSTPPPDVIDSSPILYPTDGSFSEERSSPPPVRKQAIRPVAPMQKRNGTPGSLTLSNAKVLALTAPRPEYPYEARRQKITGDGIVLMTVDLASGSVTDASMWKSTGSPVLDNAALTGFRRWRFKPGTVAKGKCPITFTMAGAQY